MKVIDLPGAKVRRVQPANLPLEPAKPLAVRVVRDFGLWTVAFYRDDRFVRRVAYPSQAEAEGAHRELIVSGECVDRPPEVST